MNQRMVLRRPRTSEGDGVPARWVSADLTRSAMESPPDGFLSSALPASSSVFLLSTVWILQAAVISLGLLGAGTNNARIAGMLRNLSSYYYKDASLLFCVRIAQGLVHLGKGLLTLNPYHSDRFLLSPTALAGIITLLHACLDMKAIILGKYHYILYFIVLAMQPRMLLTVDENLKPLSIPVRVGQAVDVVGQAGRPRFD